MKLKDRVSIVTGSGSGIGKAIAFAFAKEGAKVVINDIEKRLVEEGVTSIEGAGGVAVGAVCDVSKQKEVKKMVRECIDRFGGIDIMVNNAGTAGGDIGDQWMHGLVSKVWERTLDINLKGAINCTMAVLHHMMKKRYGKIIFINSMVGKYQNELSGPYYAAAKAGQLGFMRTVAQRIGPYGVYLNAICPGQIESGHRAQKNWLSRTEEERNKMLEKIPLGRRGTPEDIVGLAVFLASNESNYITGASIDVNGGKFMS